MMAVWTFLSKGGWILLVLAVIATGIKLYGDQRARAARAEVLLEQFVERSDSLEAELDVRAIQDSIRRDSLRLLRADRTRLQGAYRAAQQDAQEANDSLGVLRDAVDEPSLPGAVQQLLAGERRATATAQKEARKCSVVLRNCDDERGVLEAQVASDSTTIVDLRRFKVSADSVIAGLRATQGKRALGLGCAAGGGGGWAGEGLKPVLGVVCGIALRL